MDKFEKSDFSLMCSVASMLFIFLPITKIEHKTNARLNIYVYNITASYNFDLFL